jgi:hypothetical protein
MICRITQYQELRTLCNLTMVHFVTQVTRCFVFVFVFVLEEKNVALETVQCLPLVSCMHGGVIIPRLWRESVDLETFNMSCFKTLYIQEYILCPK